MGRNKILAQHEHYHLFTRGVRKQDIFHDDRDYVRFIFLLLHFQGSYVPTNISKSVSRYLTTKTFGKSIEIVDKILRDPLVRLECFTLMPNHIHICVEQIAESGVSKYMQRVLAAYAKYYNEKYQYTGHLFQSKFGRVLVEDNDQLLYLSAYIHKNQRELKGWKNIEHLYPWSSLSDCVKDNRWGELFQPSIFLGQFDSGDHYLDFVRKSTAKTPEAVGLDL